MKIFTLPALFISIILLAGCQQKLSSDSAKVQEAVEKIKASIEETPHEKSNQ
jgi:outer membrane murein-binding lipoprotein Lpp